VKPDEIYSFEAISEETAASASKARAWQEKERELNEGLQAILGERAHTVGGWHGDGEPKDTAGLARTLEEVHFYTQS